jgi:hypothetical protein
MEPRAVPVHVVRAPTPAFVVLRFRAADSTWERVCVPRCDVDLGLHLDVDSGSFFAHRLGRVMIAFAPLGAGPLVASSDFGRPNDACIAGAIKGGVPDLSAVGVPLTIATMGDGNGERAREIATVYAEHGYKVPFLPDIKLSKTLTLTQRGITF